MTKKQKLELTWIGKEKRPKLEPRILLEDPEKSYHAKQRVSDVEMILRESEKLSGKQPLYQSIGDMELCLTLYAQQAPAEETA